MTNFLRRLLGQGSTNNLRTQTRRRLEAAKGAALQPTLYAQWGVPDTFDGRFEAVLLLVSVNFARLTRQGESAAADALLTAFMQDVELALQASGVSEAGMRKKMRQVETASFARVEQIGTHLRAGTPTASAIIDAMFAGQDTGAPTAAKLDSLLHRLYADERGLDAAQAAIEELS
jgi:cytochrome b pre-mRNA-processing protein 3